jgi:hypothetical protein
MHDRHACQKALKHITSQPNQPSEAKKNKSDTNKKNTQTNKDTKKSQSLKETLLCFTPLRRSLPFATVHTYIYVPTYLPTLKLKKQTKSIIL